MARFFLSLILVLVTQIALAQTPGDLVKIEEIAKFSLEDIKTVKKQYGINTPTTSSVTLQKMTYYTLDLSGNLTIASAALAVPDDQAIDARAVVSYQHGTTTERYRAPSSGSFESLLSGAVFASAGYIVVAADYLGLGDQTSFHPYLHAETEASACADALLALYNSKLSTSNKLFLTGYSQGGHATMALHKYWQEKYGTLHPVTASAPMAGPYDLSGSVIATAQDLAKVSTSSVTYTGFLMLSMDMIYQLDPGLKNSVKAPYAEKLPSLFDGNHDIKTIASQLPKSLPDFLDATLIEGIKNNSTENTFLAALRKNDVYDWKSEAPIQFCQGDADLDVPPENTAIAMKRMTELGSIVTKANLKPGLNHGTAALPCFAESAKFFETFRK